MKTTSIGVIIEEEFARKRIDVVLAELFPEISRSQWQKQIELKRVFVNDETVSTKQLLKEGDALTVVQETTMKAHQVIPIIYQDENVIVIDKPVGVLVHAKDGLDAETTVVDALRDLLPDEDTNRPGVVHRLDRDTSGIMILARNSETKTYLQKQFENRSVHKSYVAVVAVTPKESEGVIKWPIERNPKRPNTFRVGMHGKPAETYYKVLESKDGRSLIELRPKTGRTHQLRVHLKHLGHPIIGDRFYGGVTYERLMLHAKNLEISIAHNDRRKFTTETPTGFTL